MGGIHLGYIIYQKSWAEDRDGQCKSVAGGRSRCQQPLFQVAPFHFVKQGYEKARTRCAERMARGESAAVDVDHCRNQSFPS